MKKSSEQKSIKFMQKVSFWILHLIFSRLEHLQHLEPTNPVITASDVPFLICWATSAEAGLIFIAWNTTYNLSHRGPPNATALGAGRGNVIFSTTLPVLKNKHFYILFPSKKWLCMHNILTMDQFSKLVLNKLLCTRSQIYLLLTQLGNMDWSENLWEIWIPHVHNLKRKLQFVNTFNIFEF